MSGTQLKGRAKDNILLPVPLHVCTTSDTTMRKWGIAMTVR